MEITFQINQIEQVATKIINQKLEKIVLFYGQMGAGKTTLIKNMCLSLGVQNNTSSPTFSLVNEYITNKNEIIYHFDMYRIKNEQEAINFGFEEYIESGNWCYIEWPENIPNLIPDKFSTIKIEENNDQSRTITLT